MRDGTLAKSRSVGGCPLHAMFGSGERSGGVTPAGVGVFVYGLVAYAAFFGTFLYAIGFVGNWIVPKGIDDGRVVPLGEALIVNASLLMLFVVQHTVMARAWFKRAWTRIIPRSCERSTFVLLASLILMLTFWQWRPMPTIVWSVEHPLGVWGLSALSLAGYGLVLYASFLINHFDLFGLRQAGMRLVGREYRPVGFRLQSVYRLVRHPLMVGFLVAFWATPTMSQGHLLFAILTTGYVLFGTWVEERDLIREHGQAYLDYRRRVRGLIPIPRRAA